MTFRNPLLATATLGLLAACAPVERSEGPAPLTEKNQERLDKALAGKKAGEPMRCVSNFKNSNLTPVSDDKIIYRQSSKLVYINQLDDRCPGLGDDDDILVFRNLTASTQYCEGDLVRLVDRYTGIQGATCRLGKFVPYRKSEG